MHKNMKKTVKPLILLFILNLFLFSCREDTFNEPTVLSETEMRFLNMNELKAGSLLSKEFFIEKIITDLEKQNRKKKFIPGFVQKYGYPDWNMTRWFVGNEEVVAQIPVFSDYGCETNAVIICIQHNNKLKFVLIVRDKFERFSKNEKPRPTIQKIEDLFIIFDFQRYGESSYMPDGKIVNASDKNNGKLKSGWAEVETCYYMEVYSGGELLSSRFECEYSYYWVSTENYNENEYGGGGSYNDSEWYDDQSGGGNSSGNNNSDGDNNTNEPEDVVQENLCDAYHGIVNVNKIKENTGSFTLDQEQFIISLANVAALYELGYPLESLKNDLVNYNIFSNLYSKYNKLNNANDFINNFWELTENSSPNSNLAYISPEIGTSGFQLKFYPEKNGEYNALGLVKGGVEHFAEAALEYIEGYLRDNFNAADDFLYDMHLFNALNFMNYYCYD
jgi:hypothetical protein